ncbi:type II toxin-antitoxin system YafQ family toxin [Vibrio alginolyticus]|uniref:type II toxin-antitoxin system YafQ family toxin n=1 Tax=Vibrio alginolyticus TaxID=663 RepID=UPI001EEC294B|nr:type II toxin-antitoxin system YafQ family toxin [Vibrio alginolyticus]
MLKLRVKSQFKKDLKQAAKDSSNDIDLLHHLINEHLIKTGTVPENHKPHPLKGNWKPHMECHIQPDFLLIWDVDWDNNELVLARCGSHAKLFG